MGKITPKSVFLVSGGARGITAQCVIEMAKHFQCQFVLLGRTGLQAEPAWAQNVTDATELKKRAMSDMQGRGEKPTPAIIGKMVNGIQAQREIQHTLDAVAAAGGQATYLSADITDTQVLRESLANVNHLGTVTGILHGAGNLADKLIENKTAADFENVYSAKVEGLENLLAVVPAQQLEFLVLFSSVAGFFGNVGQADYAIANEILNKTAYQFKERYPNCQVISINWGPWDGGMVTQQLREYFDKLDIRIIPVDVGTQMLVDELRAGSNTPVQIVIGSAIRPQPTPPDDPENLETYRLHRKLTLKGNPFLADHVVNGQAVMPMVAAMSWMASACEQIYRGYRYFGFNNYRVLKGIVFDDSLADDYVLELKETAKSADEILVDALVRSESANGKPRFHYSVQIVLRPEIPDAPYYEPPFEMTSDDMVSGQTLYSDGTLFHGFSFQGVEQVLNINSKGLVMRCVLPTIEYEYQGQFPVQAFNYFMADIGLQSIGIWARRFFDAGSLPLRAAKGEHFKNTVFGQTFYVTMEVTSHTETNVTARITLHDEQNRVYMIIHDLEVTMSKRLNEMFMKNRLPESI